MSGESDRARKVVREAVVIGHQTIDGVPYINGKKAKYDEPVFDIFAPWRCPECDAHLVQNKESGIYLCLNLCGLPHAWARRFTEAVSAVQRAQESLNALKRAAERGEANAVDVLAQIAHVKEVRDQYAEWLKSGGM